MKDDPIIDRIRQIRHEISAEHGHDPARLVEHYMELDRQRKKANQPSSSEDSFQVRKESKNGE